MKWHLVWFAGTLALITAGTVILMRRPDSLFGIGVLFGAFITTILMSEDMRMRGMAPPPKDGRR